MRYLESFVQIPHDNRAGIMPHFHTTREKEEYEANKIKKGLSWSWYDKSITYTVNSKGYRTKEFADIKWADSIVLMGCSEVFGQCVNDDQTINFYLETLLRTPIVNLGVPGGSAHTLLYNSHVMRKMEITPKAIVTIFPPPCRDTYYYSDYAEHLGIWCESGNKKQLKTHFRSFAYEEDNWMVKNYLNELAVRDLWSRYTTFIGLHAIHSPDCKEWQLTKPWRRLPGMLDHGRDLMHPGPKTNKNRAEIIVSLLAEKRRGKTFREY